MWDSASEQFLILPNVFSLLVVDYVGYVSDQQECSWLLIELDLASSYLSEDSVLIFERYTPSKEL